MKRHKVTRKTKSGKTVTYWRGDGIGKNEVKPAKASTRKTMDKFIDKKLDKLYTMLSEEKDTAKSNAIKKEIASVESFYKKKKNSAKDNANKSKPKKEAEKPKSDNNFSGQTSGKLRQTADKYKEAYAKLHKGSKEAKKIKEAMAAIDKTIRERRARKGQLVSESRKARGLR